MNKKAFTLVELLSVILILGIIATISMYVVVGKITKSKEKLYNVQINNIKDASKKYMLENPNIDKYHINTICEPVSTLQEKGYLEKGQIINPKTNEDVAKKYFFRVKYNSEINQYDYEVTNSCEKIEKKLIGETILNDNEPKVTGTNAGLYETTDAYIFRGAEDIKNYIKFKNNTWRIISIDKENMMIKIINLNGSQYTWKDEGILNTLNNEFDNGTAYNDYKDFINKNSKWNKNVIDSLDSALTLKSVEKQSNDYKTIGLLTVGEYVDASLEKNCYENNNCTSYLSTDKNYWLYNKTTSNNNWYVNTSGELKNIKPIANETLYNVYPVLYLKNEVQIKKGKGTKENPYELEM